MISLHAVCKRKKEIKKEKERKKQYRSSMYLHRIHKSDHIFCRLSLVSDPSTLNMEHPHDLLKPRIPPQSLELRIRLLLQIPQHVQSVVERLGLFLQIRNRIVLQRWRRRTLL